MTPKQAFAKKLADIFLTVTGKVVQILTDDTEGDPHQRFIIQTQSGQTVLVCHNLERAYRVPICAGDKIEVHGAYIWNKHGGLVHNTHHDDRRVHEDGWINLVNKKKDPNLPNRYLL